MDKLISLLEEIISDIAFSGTNEIRTDVLSRLYTAQKLCRELNMSAGEQLCSRRTECASEHNSEEAAIILCRLCCYTECLSGLQG